MSTLKVDTYLTRGGASEIAIDKLKGVTAAGSMLVVAEGGTNTTNLQQGLCKAWCLGAIDAALVDSFNISGGTDNGTGDYTYAFSTNFGSNNIAPSGNCVSDENVILVYTQGALLSSAYRVELRNDSTGDQNEINSTNICGDLA